MQQQQRREAQPPVLGWPPLTFPSGRRIATYEEVVAVRNELRQQRRMRRRGLPPDVHLPSGYRLYPDVWDRAQRRYGWWLAGAQLSEQDIEDLNNLLRVVLAPVTIHGPHMGVLSANEEYCNGELTFLALGHVVEARMAALCGREGDHERVIFDVRDPPAVREVALRELGWPEGRAPTWGQLASHIVDCLEFGLAMSPVEAGVAIRRGDDDDDGGKDFRDFDDDDDPPAYARGYAAAADGGDGGDDAAMACAAEGWEMGSDSGSESDAEF